MLETADGMTWRPIPLWVAIAVTIVALAVVAIIRLSHRTMTLTGVVLRQDPDPRKQAPISGVKVTATEGGLSVQAISEGSGLFRIQMPNRSLSDRPVMLAFSHPDFQPIEMRIDNARELYVVRMKAVPMPATTPVSSIHEVIIKDVRVRYAEKTSIGVSVGSAARTFSVPNVGNVPCASQPPCSPNGRWKATLGGVTMDAGEGQQFTNSRVSCIAGPCPFTTVETGATPSPGRTITVRVRNWSDTVTFLVEAEVTRAMPNDAIRQAYPAIYGKSMSFTLPPTAEGPSIEADFGGSEIVFPLGPALQLSWADCSQQTAADQTKLYLCELKPGYEFR